MAGSAPLSPLASPAFPLFRWLILDDALVLEATQAGKLRVSPADRLTGDHDALIKSWRNDLVALARTIDPPTQDRCRVFAAEYAARAPGVVVPRFQFRAVPYVRGRCHSCGDPLVRFRWGLCRRCAIAWRLVLDVPIRAAVLDTHDEARLSA